MEGTLCTAVIELTLFVSPVLFECKSKNGRVHWYRKKAMANSHKYLNNLLVEERESFAYLAVLEKTMYTEHATSITKKRQRREVKIYQELRYNNNCK